MSAELASMMTGEVIDQTYVQVPATLDEVVEWASGLSRLLTAKEWERAAIVYAWTEPQVNQSAVGKSLQRMGVREFARQGITGLKDASQVRQYRKAWQSAVDAGVASADIKPGDAVELPDLPWKEHFGEPTNGVQHRVARAVLSDPVKRAEFMEDERNLEALTEAAEETPTVARRVAAKVARDRLEEMERVAPRIVVPPPANRVVEEVIEGLRRVFRQTTSTGLTYRDVIHTVQENPHAVELRDPTAPTAHQSRVLGEALRTLGDEALRLAEPLQITEGNDHDA